MYRYAGVEALPAGNVFFNAKIDTGGGERAGGGASGGGGDGAAAADEDTGTAAGGGGVRLVSGVATVKRDVPASFMGANYSGILAEYIVVGTFIATRRN